MSLVVAFTAMILSSEEPRFERHDVVALAADADRVDWYENVPPPVHVGSRLGLFVDGALIGESKGVELRLHRPIPREAVFQFDAPWEGAMSAYVTVFRGLVFVLLSLTAFN